MKRIYIAAAIIASSSVVIAQSSITKAPYKMAKERVDRVDTKSYQNQQKALGVVFWSDAFDTPANWVANNDGQTSPYGWNIGSTTNTWWSGLSSGISSTSGGNFAEVYNGDYYNDDQAIGVTYTLTTASPIDVQTLAGTDQVALQFEQSGANFNDLQEVQISTDGTVFTTVFDNLDKEAFVGNNPSAYYDNPDKVLVNISSYIAGNAGSVYIRFSWTSAYSSSTQTAAWTTFGWFIDDVALVTLPDYDLQVNSSDWESIGLHYYQIPNTQVAPIDFWATVSNEGGMDMTNVLLEVDVNTGVYTGASAAATITPGSTDSLYVTTPFTPSGNGTYNFTWSITSTEVDDVPTNNQLTGESFVVNDFIYARDTDGTVGSNGGEDQANPGDFAFEAGNLFDIFADQAVYSVDVVVGSGTPNSTIIYGKIYELDFTTGDFIYVDETEEYTVGTADAGKTINMILFNSPTLVAGKTYYACVGTYSEFYYGTSGTSPAQTCFILYGGAGGSGSQYYTTQTPMVRMNFDPSIGVEEFAENGLSLGQNMPNPFGNTSKINFEIEASENVRFEFVDVMGKVVKTMNLGKLSAGTHSVEVAADEFAAGVYYYSLIAGSKRLTNKMIVE